ncbi:glycerophosphodiester phosphodiesterase family protein [Pseudomonas sp. HK3]
MRAYRRIQLTLLILLSALSLTHAYGEQARDQEYQSSIHDFFKHWHKRYEKAQLGPRPQFLVNDMAQSPLKKKLQRCDKGPFKSSKFSIGHRGASMQFPEHTKESYVAAAKMGAGIVECDVTFTKDKELVCRHSQCDLHTTTNILATPLASQCSVPPEI